MGIQDLALAMSCKRFLNRLKTERVFQRDLRLPRQNFTAEPVEVSGKADKATRHRDIGYVHRPEPSSDASPASLRSGRSSLSTRR